MPKKNFPHKDENNLLLKLNCLISFFGVWLVNNNYCDKETSVGVVLTLLYYPLN